MGGEMSALLNKRDWKLDKKWSDRFLPEIKEILGRKFIGEIPKEDKEHNTDLMIINSSNLRVSCRVRSFDYYKKFKHEFTIHSERETLAKTEFEKIMMGWGDVFFYGFSDKEEEKLLAWALIDLRVFRHYIFYKNLEIKKTNHLFLDLERDKIPNPNGSGFFLSFKYKDFPKELVIDQYGLDLQPSTPKE